VLCMQDRAANAAPAIIEEVCEKFLKPGVSNLAAGYSYWAPPQECIIEVMAYTVSKSHCRAIPLVFNRALFVYFGAGYLYCALG